MSALGGCTRGLVAARLGETPSPPPAWLQKKFDESSALEQSAIDFFCEQTGANVIWTQHAFRMDGAFSVDGTEVFLLGHIDGLDDVLDEIIEVKVLGPGNFSSYQRKGLEGLGPLGWRYRMQASCYAYASDRQVRFVILEKDEGKLTGEMLIEPWGEWEPVPRLDIERRVANIEELALKDEYPPCDAKCYPGSEFWHIHEDIPDHLVEDASLARKLQEYNNICVEIDRLGALKDDLREEIMPQLSDGRNVVSGWRVTKVKQNPTRFDAKAHARSHPDCHKDHTVPGRPYEYIQGIKPVDD